MAVESTVAQPEEQQGRQSEFTKSGLVFRPNVDILENKDELLVLADLPGVKSDDIDIRFEDGTLTLQGRAAPRQDPQTAYLLREYGVGDFYRTFTVSEQIDASRITAESRDGVLVLHLPKVEAAKPRKISVQAK